MKLIDADKLLIAVSGAKPIIGIGITPVMSVKDVEALIWNFPDAIIRCCECQHWDKESGLTARMCDEWCKFTTQYEFCARGKKRGKAD